LRAFSLSDFPTQKKVAFNLWGWSKRVTAMTHKVITLEFIVPTVLAIALAISLSVGAVYLTDRYLGPIEQAEAHYTVEGTR
jgi:hypothetical protein